MADRKRVRFCGDSLEALRRFPESARRKAGFQIDRLQLGLEPEDWKPMAAVGSGVREIRVRDEQGIFRVLYVTKIASRICILHCFQKKSQQTNQAHIELAARRYKELVKEFG